MREEQHLVEVDYHVVLPAASVAVAKHSAHNYTHCCWYCWHWFWCDMFMMITKCFNQLTLHLFQFEGVHPLS